MPKENERVKRKRTSAAQKVDASHTDTWGKVNEMVGAPDYGVAFSVWPWPDGGWMAGVALTDKDWATEQKLPKRILKLKEVPDPAWNIYQGFKDGINVHDIDPVAAIDKLHSEVTK